jgi:ADP-heptose:LPS heptosyltransferase
MVSPERLMCPSNVNRILAVAIGGLGDTVLFSPVLNALRSQYPDVQIELLLASRLAYNAYASAGQLNRTTVLNLNNSFLPIRIARLLLFGSRSRVNGGFDIGVFATGLNPRLPGLLKLVSGIRRTERAPNPPTYSTDLACNVALAQRFDDKISEHDVFIPLTEESCVEAKEALRRHGVSWDESRIIAVCPSTDMWHRPRWELIKLKQVVLRLLRDGFDGKVVVIGTAREGKEWEQAEMEGVQAINLAGKLSISASASLLNRCCLALCNDGGLMHVAGTVSCPVVVVMPNAPLSYHPPGENTAVIHSRLSCSMACYPRRPKECKTAACLDDITIEEVYRACQKALPKS